MKNNSRLVFSNQLKKNTKLLYCLEKNCQNDFTPSINKSTFEIYEQIKDCNDQKVPIILDNGCGTGSSSLWLAAQNPNAVVFGIDRSVNFIKINKYENVVFAQVEISQLWRLLWEKKVQISKAFLFYPNPWPKSKHLTRRWHAHPAFKYLTDITNSLELRTNWELYALEAQASLEFMTDNRTSLSKFKPNHSISLHEDKYMKSGHDLFKLVSSKDFSKLS
ncbi:methyltransferase domain-containing protein [Pseudomonadota bacterium]|nr:methyltransferase domain-containing protein [Pseudomonadota bacterium]